MYHLACLDMPITPTRLYTTGSVLHKQFGKVQVALMVVRSSWLPYLGKLPDLLRSSWQPASISDTSDT